MVNYLKQSDIHNRTMLWMVMNETRTSSGLMNSVVQSVT